MEITWPPLPPKEIVRGRVANQEDTAAGRAAFAAVTESGETVNELFDFYLPFVASLHDESGQKVPVQIIQLEIGSFGDERKVVVGYSQEDGSFGACTSDEIESWSRFITFLKAPSSIDALAKADEFHRKESMLATKPYDEESPVMFVTYDQGEHVKHFASKVAADCEADFPGLLECEACFVFTFEDLDLALDEINTLIDMQSLVEQHFSGFIYLGWNNSLTELKSAI